MSALLVGFSSEALVDQATAVVTGTHGPRQERGMEGVTRPQRSTSAGGEEVGVRVRVCVCIRVWMEVRVSAPACARTSTCERFHVSMQVCDASVCVRTSRGESPTGDLRSHATLRHLAADCRAAANKWASQRRQTSSKPA